MIILCIFTWIITGNSVTERAWKFSLLFVYWIFGVSLLQFKYNHKVNYFFLGRDLGSNLYSNTYNFVWHSASPLNSLGFSFIKCKMRFFISRAMFTHILVWFNRSQILTGWHTTAKKSYLGYKSPSFAEEVWRSPKVLFLFLFRLKSSCPPSFMIVGLGWPVSELPSISEIVILVKWLPGFFSITIFS